MTGAKNEVIFFHRTFASIFFNLFFLMSLVLACMHSITPSNKVIVIIFLFILLACVFYIIYNFLILRQPSIVIEQNRIILKDYSLVFNRIIEIKDISIDSVTGSIILIKPKDSILKSRRIINVSEYVEGQLIIKTLLKLKSNSK